MKLYEINREIENLIELASLQALENDGEISESISTELSKLQISRGEKIDNICWIIKKEKIDQEAIQNEITNLQKRKKTSENISKSVKEYLKLMLSGNKFKSATNNVWYKSTTATKVPEAWEEWSESNSSIPEEIRKVQYKASKTEIKALLESGKNIDGCEIVNNVSIIIK